MKKSLLDKFPTLQEVTYFHSFDVSRYDILINELELPNF